MRDKKRAIAIKYDEGIEVPIVMAKEEGKRAEQLIDEAINQEIPVTENTMLVDMLRIEEVGQKVPENAWKALAEIFAFILEEK